MVMLSAECAIVAQNRNRLKLDAETTGSDSSG
jgi:hypothetical protein